jgi:hypothetical protein
MSEKAVVFILATMRVWNLSALLIVFQYVENVSNWNQACENMSIPSEIIILETAIHQHQNLYESMCQAYTEVSRVGHLNASVS